MTTGRPSPAVGLVVVALALVASYVVLLGALDHRPRIIDGLSIGPDAGCGACTTETMSDNCNACESVATAAARHLDADVPGHSAIDGIAYHLEGPYPGECPHGETAIRLKTGTSIVAVVTFVDGTVHAVSISCGVGGCR